MSRTNQTNASAIILLSLLIGGSLGTHLSQWTFKYHKILDHNERIDSNLTYNEWSKVQLWWNFDDSYIWFRLKVRTLGYVSFGFSKDDHLSHSDMIRAWITPNGTLHFRDCYMENERFCSTDILQDYEYYGIEQDNCTIIDFKRKLDTCDPMDLKLTADSMFLHWAYNKDDPESWNSLLTIGMVQGTNSILLFNQHQQFNVFQKNTLSKSVQLKTKVSNLQNTYMCEVFQLPTFTGKRHVIKRDVILPSELRHSVKHIVLYACSRAIDMSPYLKDVHSCYQQLFPQEMFYCNDIITGWTVGSDDDFYWPEEAGFSLGTVTDPHFVMLEILFDQMPPLNDISAMQKSLSIGVELTYTNQIRQFDSGVLSTGPEPSDWFFVPPGQSDYVIEGHCVGKCTASDFPSHGVTVYATQFYTHGNVRVVKSLQIRNGREHAYIANDANIMTDYQNIRYLNTPVIIKPGDNIITRCTYDTSAETNLITSGIFWYQKPCMQFIFYYPKVPRLTSCRSEVIPFQIYSLFSQDLDKHSAIAKDNFKYTSIYDVPITTATNQTVSLFDQLNTLSWNTNQGILRRLRQIYDQGNFGSLCRDIERTPLLDTEAYNSYPSIFQKLPDFLDYPCKRPITNTSAIQGKTTDLKFMTTKAYVISTLNYVKEYEKNVGNGETLLTNKKIYKYNTSSDIKMHGLIGDGERLNIQTNESSTVLPGNNLTMSHTSHDLVYSNTYNRSQHRTLLGRVNSTRLVPGIENKSVTLVLRKDTHKPYHTLTSLAHNTQQLITIKNMDAGTKNNASFNLNKHTYDMIHKSSLEVDNKEIDDGRDEYDIVTNNIKRIIVEDLIIRKSDVFLIKVDNQGDDDHSILDHDYKIGEEFDKYNGGDSRHRSKPDLKIYSIDNISNFVSAANNADQTQRYNSQTSSAPTYYPIPTKLSLFILLFSILFLIINHNSCL